MKVTNIEGKEREILAFRNGLCGRRCHKCTNQIRGRKVAHPEPRLIESIIVTRNSSFDRKFIGVGWTIERATHACSSASKR